MLGLLAEFCAPESSKAQFFAWAQHMPPILNLKLANRISEV